MTASSNAVASFGSTRLPRAKRAPACNLESPSLHALFQGLMECARPPGVNRRRRGFQTFVLHSSFGTCIAVVVGKSVVQAEEIVCNEALPLGTVGQRRAIYGHTIG